MYYSKYGVLQQKVDDLEMTVLSVLLNHPELMKETILKDEDFVKYKKMWYFMKTFYQKFGTFDLPLMFNMIGNKHHLMEMVMAMLDVEYTSGNFKKYEEQLISLRNQNKQEKWMRDRIFYYANELINENISIDKFKAKIDDITK